MDVLQALATRRSVRHYTEQPVEEEKLELVLEAARLSPSASNQQNWKFIVVRDSLTRQKLVEACPGQTFVGEAPVILVCCGTDPNAVMLCGQHRYTVDLSIATAYMILQAHELGLGTCWLGRFDEAQVKSILGIPESVRVVTVTPLGYPAEQPATKPRKKIEEIVCYDRYS
ncbi:MAG: nitroreductase [Clostridia bacterium]|nr:nitroreductase [Clostridia bacterium]NCC75139.1 nitroreductase [Clostridia bacterium]